MHALPTPDQIVKTGIVTAITLTAVLTGLKKGGPHKTIGAMLIIIGAIGFGTFLGEQVQSIAATVPGEKPWKKQTRRQ